MRTERKTRDRRRQGPVGASWRRPGLRGLLLAVAFMFAGSGCSVVGDATAIPQSSSTTSRRPGPEASHIPTPRARAGAAIRQALAGVRVVPVRRTVPGYERRCGPGRGCSFGRAWTDNHNGLDGHDGCDTRNNVLRRQLHDRTIKPGTHGCVVLSGKFTDPYTGRQITFRRSDARRVQIDHIYPLAKAWDLGAAAWPAERRVDFANDVRLNLLAVDGSANASKGDDDIGVGPGEWMPLNAAYRCTYVRRYLDVARTWQLPITAADRDSALALAPSCR